MNYTRLYAVCLACLELSVTQRLMVIRPLLRQSIVQPSIHIHPHNSNVRLTIIIHVFIDSRLCCFVKSVCHSHVAVNVLSVHNLLSLWFLLQTAIIHPCEPVQRPIIHPYVCSKASFNICSIVPQALPSVGMVLLDLMLYNKR